MSQQRVPNGGSLNIVILYPTPNEARLNSVIRFNGIIVQLHVEYITLVRAAHSIVSELQVSNW